MSEFPDNYVSQLIEAIDELEDDLTRAVYELLRIRSFARQRKYKMLPKVKKHATSTAARIIGRQPWLRKAIEEMQHD